jgi:hypothetical protein
LKVVVSGGMCKPQFAGLLAWAEHVSSVRAPVSISRAPVSISRLRR